MQHSLDDIGGAQELALHRLGIAKEDLTSAKRNLAQDDYKTANNRAYYAIYHAICACMALDFVAYKSHGQTIGAFNRDYIHQGVFSKEIGRKISRAQEVRHESDYNDFYVVSKAETSEQIATATELIDIVEKYIAEKISKEQ